MANRYKFWITLFILAGWGVLVLGYFLRQFPFVNLPEIALNGLMLGILLMFYTALGARILRYCPLTFASLAEELSFSFGVGSGAVMAVIFALAASGGLYEILIVMLCVLGAGFVYQDARRLGLKSYHAARGLFKARTPIDRLFFLLIGLALLATFLAAAVPPFFFDALVYHLAVPQKYLLAHGFQPYPHHHFSNFPMNLGLLFMVALSFSGGLLVQLLSWSYAPLTAMAVYGFTKARWGGSPALTASAITLLVPGVLILSTLTSVDSAVMFYSFLSSAAFLSWLTSRQKSWFVLAAIFCSLALGTKYTALITTFLPLLMLLLLDAGMQKCGLWVGLQRLLVFGGIVTCGLAPWLIKNSLYTGNPIYPLLNSLIGTSASPFANYDQATMTQNPLFVFLHILAGAEKFDRVYWVNTLFAYVQAPWTITMHTIHAAGKAGVIFLLCLPGMFWLKTKERLWWYLLAIAGCAFGCWLVFFPGEALRYVFQMFPPLSMVVAYILWQFPCSPRGKSWLLGGVSVLLLYQLLLFFRETALLRPYGYLFGNQSAAEFLLEHGVNYYPVMQYINRETPANANILFVAELRGYYCERAYLSATNEPYDDNENILRTLIVASHSAAEVIQKLQALGVTHILVNKSEMKRLTGEQPGRKTYFNFQTAQAQEIFQTLFTAPPYLRPLMSQSQVDLYEVLPLPEKP